MKTIKPNLIAKTNRLDQFLRIWEDKMERLCMQQMLVKKLLPNEKLTYMLSTFAAKNWKSFRQFLLGALSSNAVTNMNKFGDGALYSTGAEDGLFADFIFPEMAFNWTKHSRRIYQVNDELAANLAATSFGDVLLRDVKLPFDSLAISLDTPITLPNNTDKTDFILLARADITTALLEAGGEEGVSEVQKATKIYQERVGKNPYYLMLFKTGMERYQKHDEKLKAKILQKLKEDSSEGLELLAGALKGKDMVYHYNPVCISVADPDSGYNADASLAELLKDEVHDMVGTGELVENPGIMKIVRIVYGLAMYLTQPVTADAVSIARVPVPEKKRNGYNLVTEAAEVLRVAFCTDRKQEDKDILSQSLNGYELGPHFRGGYWRRFPGQGKFDVAELVWVPPVIVRKDKLPDGSLPNAVAMTV